MYKVKLAGGVARLTNKELAAFSALINTLVLVGMFYLDYVHMPAKYPGHEANPFASVIVVIVLFFVMFVLLWAMRFVQKRSLQQSLPKKQEL